MRQSVVAEQGIIVCADFSLPRFSVRSARVRLSPILAHARDGKNSERFLDPPTGVSHFADVFKAVFETLELCGYFFESAFNGFKTSFESFQPVRFDHDRIG